MRHAIARAKLRYGLDLTHRDMEAIEADIAAGRAVTVRRQPDGCRIALVQHADVVMVAVVSPRGHVITFDPATEATAQPFRQDKRRPTGWKRSLAGAPGQVRREPRAPEKRFRRAAMLDLLAEEMSASASIAKT